jgi:hypothetical protein
MKMSSASLFGRLCCVLSIPLLALAVSLDCSKSVEAEDADDFTTSLQEMIVDPIMKTVQGLEARMNALDATIGAMADSFTSRRVVAQAICVSDERGAQTCITKAQLATLLSGIARAEISQPAAPVTDARAVATEEGVETVVTKDTSAYPEQAGAVEEKSVAEQEPAHTATIQSASTGQAIVLNPVTEVTEYPAPVEAAPAEAAAQSND